MKISVIIPVYNAEMFIINAVESALQFNEVSEVILIEDESSDNSLLICENLSEQYSRVKLFQHPEKMNQGAGLSRNLGIEKATGDYIAFLDADNYYLPNRFDAEKKLLLQSEIDGVYGALGIHYYTTKTKYHSVCRNELILKYKDSYPKIFHPYHFNEPHSFDQFCLDALTVRKDRLFEKMPEFFKAYSSQEDVEFSIRLSYYLNLCIGILHEPIAMLGIHEDNEFQIIGQKNQFYQTERRKYGEQFLKWFHNLFLLNMLSDGK